MKCATCSSDMPWSVSDPVAVGTKVRKTVQNFLSLLGDGGIAVGDVPANIRYYCTKCWLTRMNHPNEPSYTEDDVKVSGGAPPAQTLPTTSAARINEGIAFACTHIFYTEKNAVHWPRIVFVLTHELIHFMSHNSTGFQEVGKDIFNWDEAMTDYITTNIFSEIATAPLANLSMYNNDFQKFPELLVYGWAIRRDEAAYQAKLGRLSKDVGCLAEALDKKKVKEVALILARWYFTDPSKLLAFVAAFPDETRAMRDRAMTLKSETEDNCVHAIAGWRKRPEIKTMLGR